MPAHKQFLTFLFLVIFQHAFSQKRFDITISLDSNINSKQIFCSYENGKDTVYVKNKFVNNICRLKGEFYSKFTTIEIDYFKHAGAYCSNIFSIDNKAAKIHFIDNNSADETQLKYDNIQNATPVSDTATAKLKTELLTFREKQGQAVSDLYEKHHSEIGRNDSITFLSQKLYKSLNDQTILFLRKYPKEYFSFWFFCEQVVAPSLILMRKDTTYFRSLIDSFKSVFPDVYTESFEGQEIIKELDGLIKDREIKQVALPFSMKDVEGNIVNLSDFKGEYILLDFWASWCHPCRANNPILKKINTKYANSKFKLISISTDEDSDKWKEAVKKTL